MLVQDGRAASSSCCFTAKAEVKSKAEDVKQPSLVTSISKFPSSHAVILCRHRNEGIDDRKSFSKRFLRRRGWAVRLKQEVNRKSSKNTE